MSSISNLVRESRVTGYEEAIKEQLALYSRGEISQEEFVARRKALQRAHLKWAEASERRGWLASPEERRQAEASIGQAQAAKTQSQGEQLLKAYSEGQITQKQLTRGVTRLEQESLQFFKSRQDPFKRAVPPGFQMQTQYSITDPYEGRTSVNRRLQPVPSYDARPFVWKPSERETTIQKRMRTQLPGMVTLLRRLEADPDAYAAPIRRVWMQPTLTWWGTKWEEVAPPKVPAEPLQIPGPVGGPRPGSLGKSAQNWFSNVVGAWEKPFNIMTEAYNVTADKKMREYMEAKKLQKAIPPLLAATIMRFSKGVYETITLPLRPSRIGAAAAMPVMLTQAKTWEAIAEKVFHDPLGTAAELAGGLAGAKILGSLISVKEKTYETYQVKKTIKTAGTRRVARMMKKQTRIPGKIIRTEVTGWKPMKLVETVDDWVKMHQYQGHSGLLLESMEDAAEKIVYRPITKVYRAPSPTLTQRTFSLGRWTGTATRTVTEFEKVTTIAYPFKGTLQGGAIISTLSSPTEAGRLRRIKKISTISDSHVPSLPVLPYGFRLAQKTRTRSEVKANTLINNIVKPPEQLPDFKQYINFKIRQTPYELPKQFMNVQTKTRSRTRYDTILDTFSMQTTKQRQKEEQAPGIPSLPQVSVKEPDMERFFPRPRPRKKKWSKGGLDLFTFGEIRSYPLKSVDKILKEMGL